LTRTETGAGGERDEDSACREENTGERQAGVIGTSAVGSRGGDGTKGNLLDEGAMLTVDGVPGGEGDETRLSTRVDTGEAGEGERERAVENCEGGEAVGEGDGPRQCATTWSGTGKARGEGERDAAESCGEDGWLGGEGMNAGVDGKDGGEGDDWGRGATTWADVVEAGEGERESAGLQRYLTFASRSCTNFFAGSLERGGPHSELPWLLSASSRSLHSNACWRSCNIWLGSWEKMSRAVRNTLRRWKYVSGG
jgi:hypothetical protein